MSRRRTEGFKLSIVILNASVEVNNYEPVTFAELVAYNQKYKAEHTERAM